MHIKSIKRRLSSIVYIATGYAGVVMNVVLSIILIRRLPVGDFGKVAIGRTIFQSFEFSHIGIRYGFDRSLPVIDDERERLKHFWAGFIATMVSSLAFALFWAVFYRSDIRFYGFFFLSGFIYALVQLFRIYYRSAKDKGTFVRVSVVSVLLPGTIQIISFLLFGLWGMVGGLLASYVVVALFIGIRYNLSFIHPRTWPFFREIRKLLSQGYILFLTSLLVYLVSSGDRVLIEKYWGIDVVGEYAIIMFVFSIFSIFPINYTELIMSTIMRERSLSYVLKHMALLAATTFTLCWASLFALPYVFSMFMPKYLPLFPHMKIAIWSAVPYSTMSLLNYYLHATDYRIYILITNIIVSVFYFAVLAFVLPGRVNLDAVLWTKCAYYAMAALLLIFFAFKARRKLVAER